MKTFQLKLIFGNNCNRYLIQLLLQSKYLITEQNLTVRTNSSNMVDLKRDFSEAAVLLHIPAQIIRS